MVSGRIRQDTAKVKLGVVLHSAEHTARRALLTLACIWRFRCPLHKSYVKSIYDHHMAHVHAEASRAEGRQCQIVGADVPG
jgi:hypothetical protein